MMYTDRLFLDPKCAHVMELIQAGDFWGPKHAISLARTLCPTTALGDILTKLEVSYLAYEYAQANLLLARKLKKFSAWRQSQRALSEIKLWLNLLEAVLTTRGECLARVLFPQDFLLIALCSGLFPFRKNSVLKAIRSGLTEKTCSDGVRAALLSLQSYWMDKSGKLDEAAIVDAEAERFLPKADRFYRIFVWRIRCRRLTRARRNEEARNLLRQAYVEAGLQLPLFQFILSAEMKSLP